MNVSGVLGNTAYDSQSSGAIKGLEQMKAQLEEQIEKVKESKQDPKTKQQKIQNLTEQIAQLDAQIQQVRAQEQQRKMQESLEKAAEKQQEENEKNGVEGVAVSASLSALIAARNRQTRDVPVLSGARTRIKGEMNVAASEIANSLPGASIKRQMDLLADHSGRLVTVESNMAKTLGNINSEVKTAEHIGIKQAEHEREADRKKAGKVEKDDAGATVAGSKPFSSDNAAATINVESAPASDASRLAAGGDQDDKSAGKRKQVDISV